MGKLPHFPQPRRSEVSHGKLFRRRGCARWTCNTSVSAVPDTPPAPVRNSQTRAAVTPRMAERVMARLEDAEWSEGNVWLRGDIGHAWITVALAGRGPASTVRGGILQPLRPASGCAMVSNLGQASRQASGEFSDGFDQAGNLKPDLPKKPQVPIREAEQYPRLPSVAQMQKILTMKGGA
jgi:hypothetical protein